MTDITKPVTNLVEVPERRALAWAYLHQIGERGLKGQFPKDLDVLDAIAFELDGDPIAVFCAYQFGRKMGEQ